MNEVMLMNMNMDNIVEYAKEVISAINNLSNAVFNNSLRVGFTLKERSASNFFFTKCMMEAICEGNINHAKFLSAKADEEVIIFNEIFDNDIERKFDCVSTELMNLSTAFSKFIEK